MPALRISVGLVVKPRIHGLSASSRMEARSAPSAKILTRNEAISGIARHFQLKTRTSGSENPLRSFAQRTDPYEGTIRALLGVAIVHEHRAATGAMAGFDVAPAVTHDEARFQIDIPDTSRLQQQPRLRLAAGAARRVIMRTDSDAIQPQKLLQALVHLRDLFGRNQPARNVRLIGDQDKGESGFAQSVAGFANAGQQPQVRERGGRIWVSLAEDGAIDHSVAIQEYGAAHT